MDSAKFGVADNFSDSLEDVLDQSQGQSAMGGGLNAADPLISQSDAAYTGLSIEGNVSSGVTANTVGVTFDNSSESQSLGNDFTISAPSANAPAGPPAAPGPAVSLQSLANYLTTGYWSSAESRPSRYYNVDDTGSGANFGTLYFNVAGFASSLSTIYGTESADSNGISAARADMVREAFKIYGQVLGINFIETTSTATHVDFFFSDNKSGAYAGSQMVSGNGGPIDYTVINVNSGWNGGTSTIGDYTFQTFLHEIGHALGLGHQGDYNGSGGFLGDAVYENDSWALSMMSYFDQVENSSSSTTNYDYARLISPMTVDWIALNDLYGGQDYVGRDFGVNNAFTGDTTWGFNTNITTGQSAAFANLANLADTNAFTIIDSGGTDTVDFSGFSADQTISLLETNASSTTGSPSSVGGLTGNMNIAVGSIIENAVGGSGDDHIYGNDYNNTLTGNGGADVIKGLGGNDVIYGNAGIDSLYGDDGSDTITDSGENTVYGGAGNDYIINTFVGGGTWDGGDDVDTIDLSNDNFSANINLSAASFTAFGATFSNFENATGTQGNDTITGSADANVLKGAGGNDTIVGGSGIDTLSGGDGNDTLTDSSNNSVYGDDGDDTIINTFVIGGTWDGGAGNDTIDLSGDNFSANINLSLASFTAFGATFSNFENAIGTQGNDTIIGSDIANTLNGSGGDDTVIDNDGSDDTLDGGSGIDTLLSDITYVDDALFNFVTGIGTYSGGDFVHFTGFEHITVGGGADVIGNSLNNIIIASDAVLSGINEINGGGGNDTISTGAGNDILNGGAGDDSMTGGVGDDIYFVNALGDQVFEAIGGGVDRVNTSSTYVLALGQEIETLAVANENSIGSVNLTGNEFHNKIYGNDGANRLDGGTGNDWLYGNAGDDRFFVDNNSDRAIELVGEGFDRVFASDHYTLYAGQEIEVLSTTSSAGVGAINLKGNEFANQIVGNSGSNNVNGAEGNDILTGGLGTDSFIFNTTLASNYDKIIDFSIVDDTVKLDNAVFSLLVAGGALAAGLFKNLVLAAQDANDVILYNSNNGKIMYDNNGLAAGGVTLFAEVSDGLLLTNADFFVI
jgi:Ca2+-binding RTX toxin-like protein